MTMNMHRDYYTMVMQWEDVCARSAPELEKAATCKSILQAFVSRLTLLAWRNSASPSERFYAYMVSLELLVRPGLGASDTLGRLAIRPAHDLVKEWLAANSDSRV
jgi:hypothetical protein